MADETRFDKLAEKDPTDLHERFAEWIKDQTGFEPDLKSVQLACVLRIDFQRSDENQAVLEERRAAAEQAKLDRVQRAADRDAKKAAEQERREKAEARKAAKAAAGKKAKAAVEEDDEEDEEDEPEEKPVAPTRRRRPAPAAKAAPEPEKPAEAPVSRRRRRPAPAKVASKAAAVGEDFDEDDLD